VLGKAGRQRLAEKEAFGWSKDTTMSVPTLVRSGQKVSLLGYSNKLQVSSEIDVSDIFSLTVFQNHALVWVSWRT
jgi:hypothetical protein